MINMKIRGTKEDLTKYDEDDDNYEEHNFFLTANNR